MNRSVRLSLLGTGPQSSGTVRRRLAFVGGESFPEADDAQCGQDRGPDGAEITVTSYLHTDFGELPEEIAGRRVVRSLDPGK